MSKVSMISGEEERPNKTKEFSELLSDAKARDALRVLKEYCWKNRHTLYCDECAIREWCMKYTVEEPTISPNGWDLYTVGVGKEKEL